MRAGRLKHTITIQEPVETTDSVGEVVVTWRDVVTRKVAKEPHRSQEFKEFGQMQTESTVLFVMRYIPGITSKMRVVSDGLYYEIKGTPINPDNRNKELIISTIERSYDQS